MKGVIIKWFFIPSMINVLLNLWCNVSGYLSIQNEMAYFPNSWGILLYRFVTPNVAMSVLGSIFSGTEFKISMLTVIYLFILFRKGCSKMSIILPSLLVGHDGAATMCLNLESPGFRISVYSDFCVFTAFFFYLFGLMNFW